MVHEKAELPAAQICGYAKRLLCDYEGAITATFHKQQPPGVGRAVPNPGTFKVNVDGAAFENGRHSSMGAVI